MSIQRDIAKLPESNLKGYGSLIGLGYDTLVETFNLDVDAPFWELMGELKKLAQEGDARGGDIQYIGLGDEGMQIKSHGGRSGTPFILRHPDFDIDFRSPKTEWNVTVRYSSVGLWQYGVDGMRDRVIKALLTVCNPRDKKGDRWAQISSAHFAFDFYSPKFSQEMTPNIFAHFICHSSSKKQVNFKFYQGSAWGRSGYFETFTLGHKRNLEVQIYDKGKEITEASGKDWMIKVWESEGYCPPDDMKFKDVWRLELRFGKEFLDSRNIKSVEEFDRQIDKICVEAIYSKRLTQDNGDARIRRRPLHPLWKMAAIAVGSPEKMLALGKVDTRCKDEKINILRKNIAGTMRGLQYLEFDRVERKDFQALAHSIVDEIFMDKNHHEKVQKIMRKHQFTGQAK